MSEIVTESTPVSNGSNQEEILKEASNLFIQGKRNLLIHDYKSAVECLENSCRLFDSIYGVSADECGDAYLQYGIALMELARQETGVLDGVVSAQAETESSEEDEEEEEGDADEKADENGNEAEDKGDAKAEDAQKAAQIAADEELAKSLAEEDIANDTVPAAGASAGSSSSSAVGASSSQSAGSSAAEPTPSSSAGTTAADPAEEEEDAEPSSFECAWELLCLARDVFKRQIEYTAENLASGENKWKESKIKLAEALQSLGEISIEWENNEAALDLLQESLTLRKEALTSDDRLIAETYYHIGIAHSFMNEPERANDCFRSAMNVIEDRIKNLKSCLEPTQATISTDGASSDAMSMDDAKSKSDTDRNRKEKEIKELESLLPEMAAKIEDSRDQVKSTSQVLKELDDEESKDNQVVAKIHDSPMKPVNNISHLVKRKREPEAENGNGEAVKKLCPTNGSGDSVQNGSQPST